MTQMGPGIVLARSALRRGWRGAVVLAILIGIGGGAVLLAWGGARRTNSAFPRMLAATGAADVLVGTNGDITESADVGVVDVGNLPQVKRASTLLGFGLAPRAHDGSISPDFSMFAVAPTDDRLFRSVAAPMVLQGRLPDPSRADEVLLNEAALETFRGLGVAPNIGDRVPFALFTFAEMSAKDAELAGREPTVQDFADVFTPLDLKLVGVGRFASEAVANANQDQAATLLTRAFADEHRDRASYSETVVDLRSREALGAFEAAARERYRDSGLRFDTRASSLATFQTSVGPYVEALRLFALIAAATAFLVVGQALLRQVAADASDSETLRALGLRRSGLIVAVSSRALCAIVAGGAIAIIAAALGSGAFPIGPARLVETDLGLKLDLVVLVVGGVGLVIVAGLLVFAAGWFATRAERAGGAERSARTWPQMRFDVSPSVTTGVRYAFSGGGRGATPFLVTLFGLVAASAAVTCALTFDTALRSLVDQPVQWGWNWDGLYDTYETGLSPDTVDLMRADASLDGVTVGTRGTVTINRKTIGAFGLEPVRGEVAPQINLGRMPSGPTEIAFGQRTMRDLGVSVGDSVRARSNSGSPRDLSVVGEVTLPPSLDLSQVHRLGQGAVLTTEGLHALDPGPTPSFALVNLTANPTAKNLARVGRAYKDTGNLAGPQQPAEIMSYDGVRATPVILAGLLGALGLAVLANALVTSIRARRHELAVLKTLGFSSRQIRSTIAWQATALVAVTTAIGIVLGTALGRVLWRSFVADTGVQTGSAIPFLAALLIMAISVAFANVVAALPAHRAARVAPAMVLRSE